MPKQITKLYGGFRFVDPEATQSEVADAILPTGEASSESAFLCRVTKERRRVVDRITGRRLTRDWRVGHFLLWRNGEGSPDMGSDEARAIFVAARGAGLDQIIVYGRRAFVASPNIEFHQFGVRDIAEVPDETVQ